MNLTRPDRPPPCRPLGLLAWLALAPGLIAAPQALGPKADYRHVHRPAAQALFSGDAAAAAAWCRDFLKFNPDDAEAWYFLAGAAAQLEDEPLIQEALAGATRTGLPVERFLAGPRTSFVSLVQSAPFAALTNRSGPSLLLHGPLLGDVTPTSAHLWVRTAREAMVQVLLSAEETQDPTPSEPVQAQASNDYTAVIQLRELKPGSSYRYQLKIDDQTLPHQDHQVIRTAPRGPQRFAFAFGGGAAYKPSREGVWSVIAQRQPDLFLALGDNVYIDAPRSVPYQRYKYYRRQSRPEFRRLTAGTPFYAIYDDHDFGMNDCSGGPAIESPAWKRTVWEVFRQNWANPAYGGGPDQPGCWFRFARGDVDFFLLDGRYYRTDPNRTPADQRTMLGPVQREWLLRALAESQGTFKFLVSPVPWAKGTKPGSLDTWDGFDREREQIFMHIARHRIEGVVLLSADRHRHDIWRIDRPEAYPLLEFESSKITNEHTHRMMNRALFSWNGRGFGWVDVDTLARDPSVTFRILSETGREIHSHELRRSQLAF